MTTGRTPISKAAQRSPTEHHDRQSRTFRLRALEGRLDAVSKRQRIEIEQIIALRCRAGWVIGYGREDETQIPPAGAGRGVVVQRLA